MWKSISQSLASWEFESSNRKRRRGSPRRRFCFVVLNRWVFVVVVCWGKARLKSCQVVVDVVILSFDGFVLKSVFDCCRRFVADCRILW